MLRVVMRSIRSDGWCRNAGSAAAPSLPRTEVRSGLTGVPGTYAGRAALEPAFVFAPVRCCPPPCRRTAAVSVRPYRRWRLLC